MSQSEGFAKSSRKQIKTRPNTPSLCGIRQKTSLVDLVSDLFFPFTRQCYPGIYRGLVSMMPRHYTDSAIRMWRYGRAQIPIDVAEALARQCFERANALLNVAEQLQSHADKKRAQPRRLTGFCAVHESGRDKRGNWRR